MPMPRKTAKVKRGATMKAKKSVKITKTIPVKPMKLTQQAQVATLVKKMLGRQMENKMTIFDVTDTSHNSSISNADCYPLIGPIPQGTDNWNRIGDKIKPKYMKVQGFVALNLDAAHNSPAQGGGYAFAGGVFSSPMIVRVIAFTQNDIKSATNGSSVDVSHLLRSSSGNDVAFNGYAEDLLRPVNTDKFKVIKDKQIQLVPLPGQTVDGAYKTYARFSFKVKVPSTFKYDAASANVPNNYAPFIALGYSYPNGSSPDVGTTPVRFVVKTTLVWEDA